MKSIAFLAKEGLEYKGNIEVTHFLSVLHKEIGPTALKEKITRPFKDLKIATHYGCHALRPSDIMQFDNAVAPVLFDQLVETTGAKSIDWPLKLECCGAPLLGVNDGLSMDLTERKLADGKESGADYLCVACPWCQMQFDSVQEMMTPLRGTNHRLPSILYPQLLGLAMGIDGDTLGIKMNEIDISGIEAFFSRRRNAPGKDRFGNGHRWRNRRHAGRVRRGRFRLLCLSCRKVGLHWRDHVPAGQDLPHQ